MEEQLVTLAIHTYEKAQILKTILESEGIEVYIHNVNLIQPVISAGVRIRIKESDLIHALRIINDIQWLNEKAENEKPEMTEKKVLIPIDFSDYSLKACEIGLHYASRSGAEVMLLHVYYSTYIPPVFPFAASETIMNNEAERESIQLIHKRVKSDIENVCAQINSKIEAGELPRVKYNYILREGLPEEEIIAYAKEYRPMLIVMGTRGKVQKNMDMIGSVTEEVIELTHVPLIAVPEQVPFNDLGKIKHLAFATSFAQHDLIAFDRFVELFKNYRDINIQLFNISTSKNEWNEIRLTGFDEYLKKQYPNLTINHTVLRDGDLLEAIEAFVKEKQIDMIALSTHRRSTIMRIFNPSIAQKMLFHSNTPLFVLPI
ncbi:MAG: universal stress protein [Dysgonamonadaceae bacterium]|jgi:nucleotide-binding universal stress UspA family protein|nr:universal stress protein [Dysgonamonadaceae bacterium]